MVVDSLADLGGVPGTRPPSGTQFFHFCIHCHRKASALQVNAPLMGRRPPTGNPGSATEIVKRIGTCKIFLIYFQQIR